MENERQEIIDFMLGAVSKEPSILDAIHRLPLPSILALIKENQGREIEVTPANIPQFSNFNSLDNVLRVLIDSGIDDIDFECLGYFLINKDAKEGAKRKYGENHYKLAASLGLTYPGLRLRATPVGFAYYAIKDSDLKAQIVAKLCLRVPIVQQALLSPPMEPFNMYETLRICLAESTAKRRRPNVKDLLTKIWNYADADICEKIDMILWGYEA